MKTLKVLLQEVVSGIKAWVNSNFAQESNTVHKTGNETVNGVKTFTGNVFQNQVGGVNVYCATCDGAVKGDLTSSGTFSIVCKDGSNANMEASGLAAVYMGQDTSGSYVALRADTSYNNTRYNASVSLDIDPTTANNNAIFRPRRDNTIDLGSSSYQFKNLYANNYYYKGTAWGLDKANEWTQANTFKTTVTYDGNFACYWKRANLTAGTLPSSVMYYGSTRYTDSAGTTITLTRGLVDTSGKNYFRLYTLAFNDTSKACSMGSGINADGSGSYFAFNAESIFPQNDNTTDLGTADNRWKSFNGLNPGVLGLPKLSSASITLDISAQGLNWDLTGATAIEYTPPFDGWLQLRCNDVDGDFLFAYWQNFRQSVFGKGILSNLSYGLAMTIPVRKDVKVTLFCKASSNMSAIITPCIGNV